MSKILIADDSFIQRKAYEEILDYLGHDFISCENGKQALEKFAESSPIDLVILDYDMPEMNGLEACRSIRQMPAGIHVPIVIVSSHDEEEYIINCMNAGANDYLVKPVRESHLIAKLKNFLQTTSLYKKELDLAKNKTMFAGRYKISKILGYGSHSVVFRAEDTENANRQVAIKLLNEQTVTPDIIQPFITTAEKIRSIDNENLLKIHDFGQFGGQVYLVLEFANAGDLSKKIKARRLRELEAVNLAFNIMDALKALHEKGILHLDLKPENIMIQDDTYKLGDFGIITARETATIPLKAELWSTVAYASPEMIDDSGTLDFKCDIYSLGVTLYEAVTGDNPFTADRPTVSMFRQLNSKPPPVSEVNEYISEYFSGIIASMLAKEAGKRPDYAELEEQLSKIIHNPECYIIPERDKPSHETLKSHEETEAETAQELPPEQKKDDKHSHKYLGIIRGRIRNVRQSVRRMSVVQLAKVALVCVLIIIALVNCLGIVFNVFANNTSEYEQEDAIKCRLSPQPPKDLYKIPDSVLKQYYPDGVPDGEEEED